MAAQRVAQPDSAGPAPRPAASAAAGTGEDSQTWPWVTEGGARSWAATSVPGCSLRPQPVSRATPSHPPATESLPNSSGGADAAPALASSERGLCSDSGALFISTPPEGLGTNGARKAQTRAPHAGRGERGPSARLPGSAPTCRSGSGAHEASAHRPWGRPGTALGWWLDRSPRPEPREARVFKGEGTYLLTYLLFSYG